MTFQSPQKSFHHNPSLSTNVIPSLTSPKHSLISSVNLDTPTSPEPAPITPSRASYKYNSPLKPIDQIPGFNRPNTYSQPLSPKTPQRQSTYQQKDRPSYNYTPQRQQGRSYGPLPRVISTGSKYSHLSNTHATKLRGKVASKAQAAVFHFDDPARSSTWLKEEGQYLLDQTAEIEAAKLKGKAALLKLQQSKREANQKNEDNDDSDYDQIQFDATRKSTITTHTKAKIYPEALISKTDGIQTLLNHFESQDLICGDGGELEYAMTLLNTISMWSKSVAPAFELNRFLGSVGKVIADEGLQEELARIQDSTSNGMYIQRTVHQFQNDSSSDDDSSAFSINEFLGNEQISKQKRTESTAPENLEIDDQIASLFKDDADFDGTAKKTESRNKYTKLKKKSHSVTQVALEDMDPVEALLFTQKQELQRAQQQEPPTVSKPESPKPKKASRFMQIADDSEDSVG
ncbi:hypothetical protein BLNAU_11265 [Blattamonas nauphoetae]|uniref:Uncharacterized protein n=1 Tax=Blattamonas nauphoetae TaxID=2049346 RepID=A0ABQ9XMU1_9EUKA|nr:hypothetical protein BLNAU_11265 [Blattamonas nauphoetae]